MSPRVSLAAPHERLAALRLLFPHSLDVPHQATASAAVLVTRDSSGHVRGAILAQLLPGALGLAMPPRAESAEEEHALADAALAWLQARGVKVCQIFTPANDARSMASLETHGFRRLTQLVSMHCPVVEGLPLNNRLTFSEDAPPFSEIFRATLLATHHDTLDCPELNGTRTPDELVASFTEPIPGGLWYLAQHQGVAIGVLMLVKGPEPEMIELSYLGVLPEYRRHGLGRELIAFALTEAARHCASSLTVAVDARNEPALRLYHGLGFCEIECQEVWLAQFPE